VTSFISWGAVLIEKQPLLPNSIVRWEGYSSALDVLLGHSGVVEVLLGYSGVVDVLLGYSSALDVLLKRKPPHHYQ
jgi:hypothetical protein